MEMKRAEVRRSNREMMKQVTKGFVGASLKHKKHDKFLGMFTECSHIKVTKKSSYINQYINEVFDDSDSISLQDQIREEEE